MYSLILHGKRLVQMPKWRDLKVSVMSVQNSTTFSSSFYPDSPPNVSPPRSRNMKNYAFRFLKGIVDSGGSGSVTVWLFRSYGFTDCQILAIISTCLNLLSLDANELIEPKLKFLQSRAASNSEFTEIISTVPFILRKNRQKTLSLYFDFVKDLIKEDKSSDRGKLSHSFPQGNKATKIRNFLVLKDLGVNKFYLWGLPIFNSSSVYGNETERFDEIIKKLLELGFNPYFDDFTHALKILSRTSNEKIEEKVQLYKSLGLTVDDVWEVFKKFPIVLGLSEKKLANSIETFLDLGFSRDELGKIIKRIPACAGYSPESVKKIAFMLKDMNWPIEVVVSFSKVLGYSMEKRIVPRCNVIKALMLKGLLKDPPLSSMLSINDTAFHQRYVLKYGDDRLQGELMAILRS